MHKNKEPSLFFGILDQTKAFKTNIEKDRPWKWVQRFVGTRFEKMNFRTVNKHELVVPIDLVKVHWCICPLLLPKERTGMNAGRRVHKPDFTLPLFC